MAIANIKILVDCIDYYSVGEDLKAISVLNEGQYPKELNDYKSKFSPCKLIIQTTEIEKKDREMETLLDYIPQKELSLDNTNFVTSKDVLTSLACNKAIRLSVWRDNNVIYILRMDGKPISHDKKVFELHMTKDKDEKVERYGVFMATVFNGDQETWNILYSGTVDAITTEENEGIRHYELGVSVEFGPLSNDWEKNCSHYWRSFFGKSPTCIFGLKRRLEKNQRNYEISGIKEIESNKLKVLPDGEKNINNFFQLLRKQVDNDGENFIFSKDDGSNGWRFHKPITTMEMLRKSVTMFGNIKIDTVDHYTRDEKMELVDAAWPKLNCQPEKREINPPYRLTTPEYLDSGKEEEHMESLLHYIHEQDTKPNIVTIRQLMTAVACGTLKKLFIIPFMGILFLLPKKKLDDETWPDEASSSNKLEKESLKERYQHGGNFHHYMTRKHENEPISTERNSFKAVLKTTIDGQSIIYSGEIDALGAEDEHYEFKAISGGIGNDEFFSRNSQKFYWQSYFGNVDTILVGARTDKEGKDKKTGPPHNWPEFSLYQVQKLMREDIPGKKYLGEKQKDKNNNNKNLWNVETGTNNIHEFFKSVKEKCTLKEVFYVATSKKSDKNIQWTFESVDENHEDREEVKAFCETLQQILGNDEKKLLEKKNEDSNDDFRVTPKQNLMKNSNAKIAEMKLKKTNPIMESQTVDDDSDEYFNQDSDRDLGETSKKQLMKESKAKTTNKKPMKRGNPWNVDSDEDFMETSEQKSDNREQYKRNMRSRYIDTDDEESDEDISKTEKNRKK